MKKIVIITGNNLRHKYFVKSLNEKNHLDLVIFQEKIYESKDLYTKEIKYFSDLNKWYPNCQCLDLMYEQINSTRTEKIIREINPDIIFTFGCGLLKKNIFSIPLMGCINLHTGLTQYYRGVDSSLWAIYNDDFNHIGSTLHFIDDSIDGGGIIDQVLLDTRDITFGDNIDDIFLKTCMLGTELLERSLDKIFSNKYHIIKIKNGKLFQIKDKSEEVVLIVNKKINQFLKTD